MAASWAITSEDGKAHGTPVFWGVFAAKFDEISNKLLTFKHGVGKPGV